MERNLFDYRREYAAGISSLLLSFLFYLVIVLLILIVYKPDSGDILSKATEVGVSYPVYFKPEPIERLLFFLSLVVFPIFLTIFYAPCYRFFHTNDKQGQVIIWSSLLGLLLLIYLSMISKNPYGATSNFRFYFSESFLCRHFYLYSFLVYPFIGRFLLNKNKVGMYNFFERKISSTIGYTLFFFILLLIFSFNIFCARVVDNSGIYTFHFNAVFYSVSQVFRGNGLLCAGFTNTYGLYPYFLLPLFKIINLNVFKFTFIMSLLTSCSFLFVFFSMRKIIRNRVIFFLGFTSLIFLVYLLGKIVTLDYYYQYHPLRCFFPFLIAFLAVLYVEKQKRLLYYSICLLATVAVFWNFDSGMIVYSSWLALLLYVEVSQFKSGLKERRYMVKNVAQHVLTMAAMAMLLITLFIIYTKWNFGKFPIVSQFFGSTLLFSTLGYFMLPMPLLHPWNIVLLTYFVGMLIPIRALIVKIYSKKAAIIFFFSFLGLGSFTYYQGRSHNWNLLTVSTPFFILLSIFADSLLENIREQRLRNVFNVGIFLILVYILSFSFIDICTNYSRLVEVVVSRYKLCSPDRQKSQVMKNIEFIKKYTTTGEKILIFSGHQGVYFAETATSSSFQPGLGDLFFRRDYERLTEMISTGTTDKIFIDSTMVRYIGLNIAPDFFTVLKRYYNVVDSNGTMALLTKRN